MSATQVGFFAPGSLEWHEARRRRLGGSEIAAVLGLSPFESRFSLWHRKMGMAGPQGPRPEMEWGNRLEPVVASKFLEVHPEYDFGRNGETYINDDRPWQTASPDVILADQENSSAAILEVKTSIYGDGWGEPGTDEIPVYYRCQVLWYLSTLAIKRAHVAVLISGYDYREYLIEMDDQAVADIGVLLTAGEEFIQSLEAEQRPNIDDHNETLRIIREQHPEIDPVDVEIDWDLGVQYLSAVLDEKESKAAKQYATSKILDELGRGRNAVIEAANGKTERIAYRKANGEHTPFLCPDPKAVKARSTTPTIQGSATA